MAVGQEKLGFSDESVVKAMGAYGGGVAASGETCGILLGSVALISSIYSRGNSEEKEDPQMWSVSAEFTRRFKDIATPHGGICCREIARVDWSDRKAVKGFYKDPNSRRKVCVELVGEAARILGVMLEEEREKKRKE